MFYRSMPSYMYAYTEDMFTLKINWIIKRRSSIYVFPSSNIKVLELLNHLGLKRFSTQNRGNET